MNKTSKSIKLPSFKKKFQTIKEDSKTVKDVTKSFELMKQNRSEFLLLLKAFLDTDLSKFIPKKKVDDKQKLEEIRALENSSSELFKQLNDKTIIAENRLNEDIISQYQFIHELIKTIANRNEINAADAVITNTGIDKINGVLRYICSFIKQEKSVLDGGINSLELIYKNIDEFTTKALFHINEGINMSMNQTNKNNDIILQCEEINTLTDENHDIINNEGVKSENIFSEFEAPTMPVSSRKKNKRKEIENKKISKKRPPTVYTSLFKLNENIKIDIPEKKKKTQF